MYDFTRMRVIHFNILNENQGSCKVNAQHLKVFLSLQDNRIVFIHVYLNRSVIDCSYAFLSNPVPRVLSNCSTNNGQKLVTCTREKKS